MGDKKKEHSFESAMEQLEKIVGHLEQGKVSLDDSLNLFEEGVRLSAFCHGKLEELDRKIELLTKEGHDLKAVPFDNADHE